MCFELWVDRVVVKKETASHGQSVKVTDLSVSFLSLTNWISPLLFPIITQSHQWCSILFLIVTSLDFFTYNSKESSPFFLISLQFYLQ